MFELLGMGFLFLACAVWLLIGRYPLLLPAEIRSCSARFASFLFKNLKTQADFWPEHDAGASNLEGNDAEFINDVSTPDESSKEQANSKNSVIDYKGKLVAQIRSLTRRSDASNCDTSRASVKKGKDTKRKISKNLNAPPKSIIKEIKSRAVKEYPRDYSTQLYEIENQTSSYLKLASYVNKSVPESVLREIRSKAEREYPQEYSTQLYVLEEEADSYLKLASYANKSVPESVLREIRSKAEREYPQEYSTQLYELKDQADSYLKLIAYSNALVPESVLMEIRSDAMKEFSRDYSMQLYEVKEQVKSFLKIAARS